MALVILMFEISLWCMQILGTWSWIFIIGFRTNCYLFSFDKFHNLKVSHQCTSNWKVFLMFSVRVRQCTRHVKGPASWLDYFPSFLIFDCLFIVRTKNYFKVTGPVQCPYIVRTTSKILFNVPYIFLYMYGTFTGHVYKHYNCNKFTKNFDSN